MADPTDARQTPAANRDVPDLDPPNTTSRATDLPPGSPKPADGPPPDPQAPATAPVATDARSTNDRTAAPAKSGGVSPVVWIALAAVLVAGGVYAYAVLVPPDLPEDRLIVEEDPEPDAADTDDDLELEAETEGLGDDPDTGDVDDADLDPDLDGGDAEPLATGEGG